MPEDYEGSENPENLDEPPAFFPYDASVQREHADASQLVEVQIDGVYIAENAGQISQFVLVTDGIRKLPIVIGPFEAKSISSIMEGDRPDRPMTHDLMKNIVERLGYTLDRVVIDDFWNGVYYAKLYLKRDEESEEMELDARPSDAIAVAVRFDAPIYVADQILDAAMEE